MKKYLCLIIFIFQLHLTAQVNTDTLPVMNSWRLSSNFSQTIQADMDTNLRGIQVYYPQYKNSVSNSYLGNHGTATLSNVYTEREFYHNAFFLNSYLPYLFTSENTNYFNTRKQYTQLFYTFDRLSRAKEETFDVYHSQNLNPNLNFLLQYNNISSQGQYRFQKVKKNSFRISGNYTGQRYIAHASFNFNFYRSDENGGIIDTYFEGGDTVAILLPTRFNGVTGSNTSNASSQIRYYDILLSQRLKLFTIASKIDTARTNRKGTIAEPILTYVFRTSRSSKEYSHIDPVSSSFYSNYFFNTHTTSDSIANLRISNTLQLEFKSTFRRKVQVGIYGLAGYDFNRYLLISEWDTIPDTTLTPIIFNGIDTLKGVDIKKDFFDTYLSAGIYGNFWSRVKADFSGKVYLAGEKAGETELRGLLQTNLILFKNNFQFHVLGILENKLPGYLLENYYSNNYYWSRSLDAQNGFHLSSILISPSNKFELKGNYSVLRNLIYFNTSAYPENSGNIINYFSIEATKTFRVWEFYSMNKVVYQVSENQNILPLPDFAVFSSNFIDHTFRFKQTNGELQTIFGIDVYYNTSFYGYNYSPALNVFHVQNEKSIGNFPLLDLFFNIKLKRTRFFVKLQHFNSSWFDQKYYSTVHYPYNRNAVKFGISWNFYD